MKFNAIQQKTTEHITTHHDTIRYDAMWGRTQFTKNSLNISKKILFSRNRSVSKTNISFHKFETRGNELIARCLFFLWIWDHKGINLLLDFWLFSRIEHRRRMSLLLKFWPLQRISDHTGVNVLLQFWLLLAIFMYEHFTRFLAFQRRKGCLYN